MIVDLLELVCLIIIGAGMGKPLGWVVLALSVIALLLTLGGAHFHVG